MPVTVSLQGNTSIEHAENDEVRIDPVDPTPSVEENVIQSEEQEHRCRHLAFARPDIGQIEFRAVVSKHAHGKTLKQIGAAEGRPISQILSSPGA